MATPGLGGRASVVSVPPTMRSRGLLPLCWSLPGPKDSDHLVKGPQAAHVRTPGVSPDPPLSLSPLPTLMDQPSVTGQLTTVEPAQEHPYPAGQQLVGCLLPDAMLPSPTQTFLSGPHLLSLEGEMPGSPPTSLQGPTDPVCKCFASTLCPERIFKPPSHSISDVTRLAWAPHRP